MYMKNKIKLSVVIPARESQKTIMKTLNSLFSQTLKPDEIIIVSRENDPTIKAVKHLILTKKIKYIETDKGLEYIRDAHINRWVGASQSKGDYIFFTDSKVIFEKNSVEKAVELLEKNKVHAVGASVFSWPSDSHRFTSKIQDKGLIRNNPIFKEEKMLDINNFGYTESLPVTTGLLITRHAFNLIKNDFGLDYSKVASTYDDYVTAWLLIKNGINILLTGQVVTYHKHRLKMSDYFKQISRSGQSAALMLKFYPECPFASRRLIQVLGITGIVAVSFVSALIAILQGFNILSLAMLTVFVMLLAGVINAIKEKDIVCFFFPPITISLILFFSFHYMSWLWIVWTKREKASEISSYIQI